MTPVSRAIRRSLASPPPSPLPAAQGQRIASRLIIWLAAFASVALTVSLGCWQLRRAEQKRLAWAELVSRQHMPAWTNADWPCDDKPLPKQRPALLRGHWLAQHTVYLDNRPMDGASGFIVVTPLQLTAGGSACSGRVVLVERGWVPRDAHDRLHLALVPTPDGEVQVTGRVQAALSQAYELGAEPDTRDIPDAKGPLVRQNAAQSFWHGWLGQAPLAGAVLQEQADVLTAPKPDAMASTAAMGRVAEGASAAEPATLRRHWPQPGQGQDKHLAYAAQWFAMAAAIAALTLWHQLVRPRRSSQPTPHAHV
jgi:surfeit locus 1 family protein